MTTLPETHLAVFIDEPHKVSVREIPLPSLQTPKDVIVKISISALCGSEIHIYRGHQPPPYNLLTGHEFGEIFFISFGF